VSIGTITSLLAIHSLARVLRRHEREALILGPSSLDSAQLSSPKRGIARRQWPTAVAASPMGRIRRIIGQNTVLDDSANPFSDTRGLNSRGSWQSDFSGSCVSSELCSSSSSLKDDVGEAGLLPHPSPSFENSKYISSDVTIPLSRRSSEGPLIESDQEVGMPGSTDAHRVQ
jgi:hypothetical protein